MTFDEWWAEKIDAGYGEVEVLLRDAWEAATLAEREACANILPMHTSKTLVLVIFHAGFGGF